jgi:hypothetical protein
MPGRDEEIRAAAVTAARHRWHKLNGGWPRRAAPPLRAE